MPSLFSVNAVLKSRKEKELREADKKRDYEKEMDRWFEGLSLQGKADVAESMWEESNYEIKKREYELE